MDSKILYINLLVAVFCLWYTEASPLEEKYGEKYEMEDYEPAAADTRSAINDNTAKVASHSALAYVTKAKAIESKCKLYEQIYRDREYYKKEYEKLADMEKKKGDDFHNLWLAEVGRIGMHEQKEKEWASKAREAKTECREVENKRENYYAKIDEYRRESLVAYVQAIVHQTEASGYHMKAEKAMELAKDNERKAEIMRNDAIRLYQMSREYKNKGSAAKVKAHQESDDAQKHLQVVRAYQGNSIKDRMGSKAYEERYIENCMKAEKMKSLAKLEEVNAEYSLMVAHELARQSEESASISRVCHNEMEFYHHKAAREEGRAYVADESKREMGSQMTDNGAMVDMIQAKDDQSEDEGDYKVPNYPADDSRKAMPSEDKDPMFESDTGLV